MTHVAILGGGPAGLAAAQAALAAGAAVTLLDEGGRLGGQFWRHHAGITDPRMQHGFERFERLLGSLERAEVHSGAAVWSAELRDGGDGGGGRIVLRAVVGDADAADRRPVVVQADAVVVATGAHDLALPVPGWTLPGVTTAGAAQALAKRDGVSVGRRTLVAGAGPFLLPVAQSLALVGATVVGVHEASRTGALARGWLPKPWELLGKSGELAEYVGALVRHRIPYRIGSGVVRVLGVERVEGAVVAQLDTQWRPVPGTERVIECDAVALGHGFTPRLEAAIMLGCEVEGDRRGRFVVVDDAQRTTMPGVFAAGEVTGIGGADAALAEGAIAGFRAAGLAQDDPRLRDALRVRDRMRRLARRLERAHGIRPGWTAWLDDDTIVCRCEAVTKGAIAERAEVPLRAMRLATRAGLGPCQARTCGRAVEAIVAEARASAAVTGAAGEAVGGANAGAQGDGAVGFDRRPLLAPVRLGELAEPTEPASDENRNEAWPSGCSA
ncbi:FAD-dependent oxidoreductase [Agromyces sp. SYSU K20354]|uniref:FAD/NAD(P)-dependent oxidoreductase n=1 Tax=Agromyces cavernae TaxID=2898659 RepID=UPI001E60F4DB|nr:NAD(P)/FAD-dependent oxidoreductase [Agromyces cavernae]MCD2442456.1 FAD-dependent oxidoreductase [Agromyces cavernae]